MKSYYGRFYCRLTIDTELRDTSNILQQHDVVAERGGFINMATTKYIWARAFFTVFYHIFYLGKWILPYDISGYHNSRDKHVSFDQFVKYHMWREDGVPTNHPTCCVLLYNHKIRSHL